MVFVIYYALNLIRYHGTGKGKKQCFLATVNFNEGTVSIQSLGQCRHRSAKNTADQYFLWDEDERANDESIY